MRAALLTFVLLAGPSGIVQAEDSPWGRPVAESPDGPQHVKVHLTEEEALARAFPEADSVWVERWVPTDEARTALEERLGWHVTESHFDVHCGAREGRPHGWALVTNQVGLYKPITFLVKVDPDGEVESTYVMVFRESRGDEVKRQRFLRQYRGKNVESPIRLNRDITGVTGATYSVRAMNAGVKRALNVIHLRYLEEERGE